jgi:uracil-DNA glycosylase
MGNSKCKKCESLGLTFRSETINPEEYIEGNANGKIWIIGLNPKDSIGAIEKRTKIEFQSFNPDSHPYFYDFKKVSERLYANWKSDNCTVAHTDLVKCFSPTFPPLVNDKYIDREKIISNCKTHLLSQIKKHKPQVIICNGTNVCREMINFFPPNKHHTEPLHTLTSYKATYSEDNGQEFFFWIVLSGFIGRIDDRNKRRLGKEIESILECEKIKL